MAQSNSFLDTINKSLGVTEDPKTPTTTSTPGAGPSFLDTVEESRQTSGNPLIGGQVLPYDPDDFDFSLRDTDNEKLRATTQSWQEQVGLTLGNLVPNIGAGILESVGYLGALVTEWGDDRDYSNGLVEAAKEMRDPLGTVYRENPEDNWSMGDSAWWLQNFSSLAESATSFAAVGAGIGSMFLKGASYAGRLGTTAGMIGRAAAQTATAATLAYTEGAMAGYDVYQQTYATQLRRGLAQGLPTEEAEERARHISAESAATAVQLNTVINTALIAPQLSVLFKDTNKIRSLFTSGEGARRAGESLSQYSSRLATLGLPKEAAWRHLAAEAGGEGIEELTNQFAQKTGEELGESGDVRNWYEQFGELENYLDRTADSEGLLNFALGAVGGVAQTALLNRIPIHREVQRDPVTGQALPAINKKGEVIDGKYQVKLISSATRDESGKRKYFENIKDALLDDVKWFEGKQADLLRATKANDLPEMGRLRAEISNVTSLNAPAMGITENWITEYQNLGNTDNTKRLAEPYEQRAAELLTSIQQTSQQAIAEQGVNSVNELTPETKEELRVLNTERKAALDEATRLGDTTEAMQRGLADSPQDNAYRNEATKQVDRLRTFQRLYDETQAQFAGDERAEAAELADFVFRKKANIYLRRQVLDESTADLNTRIAANELQIANLNLNAEQRNKIQLLRDKRLASDNLQRVGQELKALNNTKNTAAIAKTLNKYGVTNFNPNDPKSVRASADYLIGQLNQYENRYRQEGEDLEAVLGPLAGVAVSFNENDALRRQLQGVAQLREELETTQKDLNRLDTPKGRNEFIKEAISLKESATKNEERRIEEENKRLDKILRDDIASTTLRAQQINFTVEKNNKIIAERQAQIQALETELSQIQSNVILSRGDVLGKLRSVLFPIEDSIKRKTLAARISSYNSEITRLRNQNDLLLGRLTVTPVTETIDTELTSTDKVPTSYTELVPVEVDQRFNSWIETLNGLQGTLEDAISQMVKMLREANVAFSTEQFDSLVFPEVSRIWSEQMQKPTKDENQASDAASTITDILASIPDPDDRYEVSRVIDPILRGERELDWAVLDDTIRFGNISNIQAAKLLQAVETFLNTTGTDPDFVLDVSSIQEPEDSTDDLFGGSENDQLNNPDEADAIELEEPIEEEQENELDVPEAGEPSDDIVEPSNGPFDPASLEDSRHHIGLKSIDGLRIANMTLSYEEGQTDTGDYYIRTSSTEINRDTNPLILTPGALKVGRRVSLQIDTEWEGEVNSPDSESKVSDSFLQYTDAQGKIKVFDDTIGNVPIKIVDVETGTTLGYLPRVDWIRAQYPGAIDYRNISDITYDSEGNAITGNVKDQLERVVQARTKVVERFNINGEGTPSSIADRGPGHVILNIENGKVVSKLAKNMLPDPSLTIGIVSGGVVKTSKIGGEFSGDINLEDLTPFENSSFALLPMVDGSFSLARLNNPPLSERSFDIDTMLNAIEAYLLQDATIANQYEVLTGFNILSDDGIRSFINQHYTYTQSFPKSLLQADSPTRDGQPRQMQFLFSIADRGNNSVGEVSIGYSYSGKPKLIAAIDPNTGRLRDAFINEFRRGVGSRRKNIVYTRLPNGIYGINSNRPLNEVRWDTKTNKLTIRHEHATYNDYVKSFTETPVNGTNQINGTYIYGANPQNILDLNEIQRALTSPAQMVEPGPADIEDTTISISPEEVIQEEIPQELNMYGEVVGTVRSDGSTVLSDNEMDQLDGLNLFKSITPSSPNHVDGMRDLTLEVLEDLLTFTPVNNRNGKSTVQVYSELTQQGVTQLLPGYNPFFKC